MKINSINEKQNSRRQYNVDGRASSNIANRHLSVLSPNFTGDYYSLTKNVDKMTLEQLASYAKQLLGWVDNQSAIKDACGAEMTFWRNQFGFGPSKKGIARFKRVNDAVNKAAEHVERLKAYVTDLNQFPQAEVKVKVGDAEQELRDIEINSKKGIISKNPEDLDS